MISNKSIEYEKNKYDDNIDSLIKVLSKNKFLVKKVNFKEDIDRCNLLYLNNFVDNPEVEMKRLKEKRILIIGIGGVGQSILQHLATAGLRKFVLVDFDLVRLDNFNRQFLLKKNQIGIKKNEAVKRNIEELIDEMKIDLIDKKNEKNEDLNAILRNNKIDMIICAADYPINLINKIVVEASLVFNIPCAFASVGVIIGEIGPILNTVESKKNFLTREKNNLDIIYNPILSGSICFTNTFVSVLIAQSIYNYFLKREESLLINKQILLDMEKIRVLNISSY